MDHDPQYRTADGSAVRIWKDAAKNNFLSEQQGRPIFDEVTFVEVISPGSRGSTPVFEVRRVLAKEANTDAPMYGLQYETYKELVEAFDRQDIGDASMSGTPLKEWPEVTRTMAASLKEARIFTVEALAALPDEKLSVVGPDGRTWREKARAFIENAADSGYATALAADLQRTKDALAEQQQANAELSQRLAQLEAKALDAPAPAPAPAPDAAETGKKAGRAAPATPPAPASPDGAVVPATGLGAII